MFDCVLPTRTARTGSALTSEGRLNLRNARYARDPRPLDETCSCPPARASPAPTSATSSTSRNCSAFGSSACIISSHLLQLTAGARAAIERGHLRGLQGRGASIDSRGPVNGVPAALIVLGVLVVVVADHPAQRKQRHSSSDERARSRVGDPDAGGLERSPDRGGRDRDRRRAPRPDRPRRGGRPSLIEIAWKRRSRSTSGP